MARVGSLNVSAVKMPSKSGKAKVAPKHPPYLELVKEAVAATAKPRQPVSRVAISKYLVTKYGKDLASNSQSQLRLALRKAVKVGVLLPSKGSFRLSAAAKKPPTVKKAKKPKAKKPKKAKKAKKPKAKKPKKPKAKKTQKSTKPQAKKAPKNITKPKAKKPAKSSKKVAAKTKKASKPKKAPAAAAAPQAPAQ